MCAPRSLLSSLCRREPSPHSNLACSRCVYVIHYLSSVCNDECSSAMILVSHRHPHCHLSTQLLSSNTALCSPCKRGPSLRNSLGCNSPCKRGPSLRNNRACSSPCRREPCPRTSTLRWWFSSPRWWFSSPREASCGARYERVLGQGQRVCVSIHERVAWEEPIHRKWAIREHTERGGRGTSWQWKAWQPARGMAPRPVQWHGCCTDEHRNLGVLFAALVGRSFPLSCTHL